MPAHKRSVRHSLQSRPLREAPVSFRLARIITIAVTSEENPFVTSDDLMLSDLAAQVRDSGRDGLTTLDRGS